MKTVCGALIADVTLGARTYVQTQYFGTTDCIAPSYASDYLLADGTCRQDAMASQSSYSQLNNGCGGHVSVTYPVPSSCAVIDTAYLTTQLIQGGGTSGMNVRVV